MDKKDIVDQKLFWKTVKPSLPDIVFVRDKINLSQNDKLSGFETAEVLNIFFSNIKNLEISKSIFEI